MKRLFTSAFLFFAIISAQAADNNDQLKAKATEETRELVQKIGLNEMEYIKIKNFTYQKLVAVQEVNEMYSNDVDMRTKKLQAIDEEYQKNLVSTLTPKQQQSFLAMSSVK